MSVGKMSFRNLSFNNDYKKENSSEVELTIEQLLRALNLQDIDVSNIKISKDKEEKIDNNKINPVIDEKWDKWDKSDDEDYLPTVVSRGIVPANKDYPLEIHNFLNEDDENIYSVQCKNKGNAFLSKKQYKEFNRLKDTLFTNDKFKTYLGEVKTPEIQPIIALCIAYDLNLGVICPAAKRQEWVNELDDSRFGIDDGCNYRKSNSDLVIHPLSYEMLVGTSNYGIKHQYLTRQDSVDVDGKFYNTQYSVTNYLRNIVINNTKKCLIVFDVNGGFKDISSLKYKAYVEIVSLIKISKNSHYLLKT